jgi:hypothetical protein
MKRADPKEKCFRLYIGGKQKILLAPPLVKSNLIKLSVGKSFVY